MKRSLRHTMILFALQTAITLSAQQSAAPGIISADDVKHLVPATYFFRGQSAPVQLRNSSGFRTAGGMFVLAGLVDTSGYASDIQQKYQGFLIAEEKLDIEGTELAPGAYGFGFNADGKFRIMDVGAHDLFSVAFHMDAELKRAVPLKIVADGGGYRLYQGKKWIGLKTK